MVAPAVPSSESLDPLVEVWPSKRLFYRVYNRDKPATGFSTTVREARFRPIYSGEKILASAYAAGDPETAVAETLLRGVERVANHSPRFLSGNRVTNLSICALQPLRPLNLIVLHGFGLQRLGLLRKHIIDTPRSMYPYTAQWAKALHERLPETDGLIWVSRQNDSAKALLIWKKHRAPDILEIAGNPVSLDDDPGLTLIRDLCVKTGFVFER